MATISPLRLSASLLGAILLRPSSQAINTALASQKRLSSGVSRLTKLHRKQKAALRTEKAQSIYRAAFVAAPNVSSSEIPQSTVELASSSTSSATLPYHVQRTTSMNLPVYNEIKAGGTKHLTLIRKTSGDLTALKADLLAALPPLRLAAEKKADGSQLSPGAIRRIEKRAKTGNAAELVTINPITGHIVLQGWRKQEVEKFLGDRGF